MPKSGIAELWCRYIPSILKNHHTLISIVAIQICIISNSCWVFPMSKSLLLWVICFTDHGHSSLFKKISQSCSCKYFIIYTDCLLSNSFNYKSQSLRGVCSLKHQLCQSYCGKLLYLCNLLGFLGVYCNGLCNVINFDFLSPFFH